MSMFMSWLTPVRRKYIYGIATAVMALLFTLGVVDGRLESVIDAVIVAVLGLATSRTDTSTDSGMPSDEGF